MLLGNLACGTREQGKNIKRPDPNVKASITAVWDTTDWKNLRTYYRLADGRIVGEDSLYSFDATNDCESDGKIRFRDRVTDKVGFFDASGRIVVPAIYNDASPFYNGMSIAIRNAKRVGWDGEDCEKGDCEHWYWSGGNSMIIDAENHVLVDTLKIDNNALVNWYSLEIRDKPADTTLYYSLKGADDKWYVFVDYQKEFDKWFQEKYLAGSMNLRKLRESAYDSLVSSLPEHEAQSDEGRMSGDEFIQKCGRRLIARLQPIRAKKIRISTGPTMFGLNPYTYMGSSFAQYFDKCGESNLSRYPAFDVTSNFMDQNGRLDYQEHYSFLRTDKGYKLIGVSWRNP